MKKSNELNGVLIYRRWCAGAIISAILVLCVVCIPVLCAIYPWAKLTVPGGSAYQITGIDLAQATFQKEISFNSLVQTIIDSDKSGYQYLDYIYGYGIYAIFGFLCFLALFGIILLIYGLVYLCAGRVANPRTPVTLAWTMFAFSVIYYGLGIGFSFLIQDAYYNMVDGAVVLQIEFLWPIIIVAGAFVLALLLTIVYAAAFKNKWFIGQAKYFGSEDPNNPNNEYGNGVVRGANGQQVVIVNGGAQPAVVGGEYPVTPVNQVAKPSVSLPSGIRAIGGHAFAKNTALRFADIPAGIKELGNGAFANCLNLEIVSIPKSVKAIHKNCFFNCGRLARINYAGTKQEWRYIVRGSNWLDRAGTKVVYCADGPIIVDPHR